MTSKADMEQTVPLAVTIGEPAGIGSDIVLAAWRGALDNAETPLPRFLLLGDPVHLEKRRSLLDIDVGFSVFEGIEEAKAALQAEESSGNLPILSLSNRFSADAGKAVEQDAAGVVEAVEKAVSLVRDGHVRGIITLPINKKSLYDAGFDFPGHTEFLGSLAEKWPDVPAPVRPVMMLAGPSLRAVPVTIHIALRDVPKHLTTGSVLQTIRTTDQDLRHKMGLKAPRIAVSGLNPHAGEQGAMGSEEQTIIEPAIEQARRDGIDCFGPMPADTMFHAAARANYDAAVCMYHDQALIPAKALAFDETVNVTLGLPFVRTSPDHGTAFDIAGKGLARPQSFVAALQLADQMSRNHR